MVSKPGAKKKKRSGDTRRGDVVDKDQLISRLNTEVEERKRAEEALEASRRQLQSILDTSSDLIYRLDLKTGCFAYFSPAGEEILGYSAEEFTRLSPMGQLTLIHPDDVERVRSAIEGANNIGHCQIEYRFKVKSGEYRWLRANLSVTRDANGQPAFRDGVVSDITGRKEAEGALRKSEERYRELVENANSIILRSDRDGNITFFNEFSQRFFGYSEAEIIGRNAIGTIIPATDSAGNDLTSMLDDLLRHPERYRTNVHQNMRKNGELVWVSWTNRAVYDERGNFTELFCVGNDITELKRAGEALQESEDLLRFVLESCHIGAWDMDLESHTTIRNPEHDKIYGYDSMLPEWTYEKFLEHVIPEDRARVDRVYRQAVEARIGWTFEFRIRRPDGQLRWIGATGNHKQDPDGVIRRVAGIVIDVTEKKLAEEALRESEARLVDELADMSRLQAISTRLVQQNNIDSLFNEFIDAAIEITRADMGNIQLYNGRGDLKIVASRGFDQEFLDFFNTVHEGQTACSAAMVSGDRVIVEDILQSPVFSDKRSLDAALAAGIRAVQSTPLVSRSGRLLGMFSTHYRTQRRPDEHDLMRLDLLARQAADLIERKQAEEALQESERRLHLAQQVARVGTFEWNVQTGEDRWTPELEAMYGLPPGRFSGDIEMWRRLVHPEDRPEVFGRVDESMEKGDFEGEWRVVWPDGSVHWLYGRAFVFKDEHSKPFKQIGVNIDITERKRADEALRESEARVAAAVEAERRQLFDMLETLPAMICLITPDYHIPYANRAFREKFGEANGRPCYEYCHNKTAPCEFCESFVPLKTGEPHHWEATTPNGSVIDVYDFPFSDLDGSPLIFEMDMDITSFRRAEKELNQSKQQAELYLDLMGHDINNMHQVALGYLELARDQPVGQAGFIDKSMVVLQRSTTLIKNVQKLRKLQEGVVQSREMDVRQVLTDIWNEYGSVPGKTVELSLNTSDACIVRANELLHDVFANLVNNAVKHTGDGTVVAVNLDVIEDKGQRCCRVTVEDNGPGIPDASKERIFNRMHKGSARGMGLGLYLVKSLVESYGGKVWVEDRIKGDHAQGARFVVLLPAIE